MSSRAARKSLINVLVLLVAIAAVVVVGWFVYEPPEAVAGPANRVEASMVTTLAIDQASPIRFEVDDPGCMESETVDLSNGNLEESRMYQSTITVSNQTDEPIEGPVNVTLFSHEPPHVLHVTNVQFDEIPPGESATQPYGLQVAGIDEAKLEICGRLAAAE